MSYNGDTMNITIRNIDDELYHEFKAEAIRTGLTIGAAVNIAIQGWLNQKHKKAPKYSFLEYEAVDFGEGTENLSENYEQYLYGE